MKYIDKYVIKCLYIFAETLTTEEAEERIRRLKGFFILFLFFFVRSIEQIKNNMIYFNRSE